jgi:BarA-like signal transduction histidine kinase
MEDLKNASPEAKEVYDKMMLGIATNMVNEIKDHQERLKKAWREMNR